MDQTATPEPDQTATGGPDQPAGADPVAEVPEPVADFPDDRTPEAPGDATAQPTGWGTGDLPDGSDAGASDVAPAEPRPAEDTVRALRSEPAVTPSEASDIATVPDPPTRPTPTRPTPTPTQPGPGQQAPGLPIEASPAAESGGEPTADQVAAAAAFGRVGADGTVLVRTRTGERAVGSWALGEPDQALGFFARRFVALQTEVGLAESRIRAGSLTAEAAQQTVRRLRGNVETAQAVGDLDDLAVRVDALDGLVAVAREQRRAERAAQSAAAHQQKIEIVNEAEQVAAGQNWRVGPDRLRALFDRWKALPRLDRATDDELWKRFSAARSTYTRRRRAHYSELTATRDAARAVKQELIDQAEKLRTSTEWGATTAAHRALMERWKSAGSAAKDVDDALWERFRAARQAFFDSRESHDAQRSASERENLSVKQALLSEAEALLPVHDLRAARRTMRGIRERWDAIGHVPRSAVAAVDGRLKAVDEALRRSEQHEWRRTDPEARRRAERTAEQLRPAITRLERAVAAARDNADERARREAEEALAARRQWLAQAEQIIAEAG